MLTNYSIGVPGYSVHGMPVQTGVPIMAQQSLPSVVPAQLASSNTSGLLEFSQMLADTKVGMSKIDLKIDEVLNVSDISPLGHRPNTVKKVESIREPPASKALVPLSNQDTPPLIDPNVVLHSITKVVEESRALKQELIDRDARIEALNQKSSQLLATNQRYVEQSQQIMAQRSDSIHSLSSANNSHIIKLQEENSALKAKVDGFKRKLESRSLEMGEQESDVNEIRMRNELLTQKMNQARNKFREKESEIDELKSEIEKLHREAGKHKSTRQTALKEATDLSETIEELRENLRTEKQSKKKIQSKITRLDEELTEIKSERDRLTSVIEDKRKKQQNEKSKLLRETDEIKRGYEEEISLLKSQMEQPTGPSQADIAKIEANWKRKMQEGIARGVSELEDKCEELEASEQKLKSQVQRLEKKVTILSLENSSLQQENSRVLLELDEFESVKSRNATSQMLIDKQNVIIEQFNLKENELRDELNESKERERELLEENRVLNDKNSELVSHQENSELASHQQTGELASHQENSEEWKDRVRHAMNKFYASAQARFTLQNTFTGVQVQEILMEAIKVETEIVLGQDTESTASTETEDSADESSKPVNRSSKSLIGATNNQLISHSSQPPDHTGATSLHRGDSPNPTQSADPMDNQLISHSSQPADHTGATSLHRGDFPNPTQSADPMDNQLISHSSQPADHTGATSLHRGDSPNPTQSADPMDNQLISHSSQPADHTVSTCSLRDNSPNPHQLADETLLGPQPSLESEDSVENATQSKSEPSAIGDDICHTVVPLHSSMNTIPLFSDSTLTTEQQPHPLPSDVTDQLGGSPTGSPPMSQSPDSSPIPSESQTQSALDHSPISSPIPSQSQTQSTLDNSPISSPIPSESQTQSALDHSPISSPIPSQSQTQYTFNNSPISSPIPIQSQTQSSPDESTTSSPNTPIPYKHLSETPPSDQSYNPTTSDALPSQPDISDNIQEYSQTPLTESPPTLGPTTPPPSDRPYKHVPSHSASPPPMDLQASVEIDSHTTGNFPPELLGNPISDDKISSLDAILGSSFPDLEEKNHVKPQTEPYPHDTESKAMDQMNEYSNPLLEGSGDSENEFFFGSARKKEPPPIESDSKPTQKSLFEDSDDDLEWLNN